MKCKVNEENFKVLLSPCTDVLSTASKQFLTMAISGLYSLMLIFLTIVQGIVSMLKAAVNDASSLLDFYYSVGSLVLIKVTLQICS